MRVRLQAGAASTLTPCRGLTWWLLPDRHALALNPKKSCGAVLFSSVLERSKSFLVCYAGALQP